MLKRNENADTRQRESGNENCVELATKTDGPGGGEAQQVQTPAEWPNGQKAVPGTPSPPPMEETETPTSKTGSSIEDIAEDTGQTVEDIRRRATRCRESRGGEADQAVQLPDPQSRQRRGRRRRGIAAAPERDRVAPPPHTVPNVSRNIKSTESRVDKIEKLVRCIGQLFALKTLPAMSDSLLHDAARKVGPVYTKLLNELARREDKRDVSFTSLKRHNRTATRKQKDKLTAILYPPVDGKSPADVAKMVVDFFRDNGREVFLMNQALEVIETLDLGHIVGTKYDQRTGKKFYSRKKARIVLGDLFGLNSLNLQVVPDSNKIRHYHVGGKGRKKAVKVTV
jgi:hypothetical protein